LCALFSGQQVPVGVNFLPLCAAGIQVLPVARRGIERMWALASEDVAEVKARVVSGALLLQRHFLMTINSVRLFLAFPFFVSLVATGLSAP
jgi:hypothetical protein